MTKDKLYNAFASALLKIMRRTDPDYFDAQIGVLISQGFGNGEESYILHRLQHELNVGIQKSWYNADVRIIRTAGDRPGT